jgi:integrase
MCGHPSSRTLHPTLEIRGKDSFREYLRDKQLKSSTIKTKIKVLKTLRNRVNLWDSELVTNAIKKANWVNRRKNIAFYAYKDWCNWKGFEYEFETFRERDSPLPYIPSEKELDQLIASCNLYYASFLQTMKETAFRAGEVLLLIPDDIDFDKGIITLNKPLKYSNPRQIKISDKLLAMIIKQVKSEITDHSGRIWYRSYNVMHRTFYNKRKELTNKLENPNFMKITFKTFRHWKATIEYHRTKDILHVKQLLGHKNIDNTLIYTHLVDFEENDQFVVKVASSLEDFTNLLENGFEYISDYEENKILRKRK